MIAAVGEMGEKPLPPLPLQLGGRRQSQTRPSAETPPKWRPPGWLGAKASSCDPPPLRRGSIERNAKLT